MIVLATRDSCSSRTRTTDTNHEKILVVQTSFLGDVVLMTPLLSEIKRRFPQAKLGVLCSPQAGTLLGRHPGVDEVIVDDKRSGSGGLGGLWRKAREIRKRGYTLALSPHKSFRSALLLLLAGIPHRVGFRQSAGWFFFHERVDRDPDSHDVERNLSLLRPFGIEPQECGRDLRVEVDDDSREAVERLFRSLGVERNGITFGINPGSVWATKRWRPEGYAELMVQLKQRYRCTILLFGGPEDCDTVTKIQALSGDVGVNLAGRLSLRELPCALDWCDVFITNDSGPMHIAVARGIPVVAVFCATTSALGFYPYSSKAAVVEKDLACRPCSSHGGRRCPLGTEDCMRLIKADDMLHAVERVLSDDIQNDHASRDPHRPEWMIL